MKQTTLLDFDPRLFGQMTLEDFGLVFEEE